MFTTLKCHNPTQLSNIQLGHLGLEANPFYIKTKAIFIFFLYLMYADFSKIATTKSKEMVLFFSKILLSCASFQITLELHIYSNVSQEF